VRALSGISVTAYYAGMLFNALLLVYGIGTHGVPVIVAACVNLFMSFLIVSVVTRARVRA
jgi:high-affinity K+ transport system ATPase subunit B